ncbi:MAG: hypothetical protein ACD_4C00444G0003 [uncultured bacterium (gcode 4)]|uniref:Fido domain-containing protein n=1 Tax=uncultured bacterium (gcode 4) TaxID=1234023 RepID=K2GRZ5_9BACT|nr:MAG: hypothetical protein ACD_4C00444G0003 [uncultured bacterium (gcode 4)]
MYQQIIKNTLLPRLDNIVWNINDNQKKADIENNFNTHIKIIWEYFETNLKKEVTADFLVWLHKILLPSWYKIEAIWNDWVKRIMFPWDYRKHYLSKYITDFSSVNEIEKDLKNLLDDFNSKEDMEREDILRLYFDFWKIHPFADSNWTISAILCDVLCFRNKFEPLNMLNLRFKDKRFLFGIIELYGNDKTFECLTHLLNKIDNFNK